MNFLTTANESPISRVKIVLLNNVNINKNFGIHDNANTLSRCKAITPQNMTNGF